MVDAAATVLMITAGALFVLAFLSVTTVGMTIAARRIREYVRRQRAAAGFALRVRR